MKPMSHDANLTCIGLVGLGLVGCALNRRLRAAGFAVLGLDVRPEAMQALEAQGGQTCSDWTAMIQATDTLVLSVFDTAGVEDVAACISQARSTHGDPKRPMRFIDCSTGDPDRLAALALQLAPQSIGLVEAPLSGSSIQIERGEATLLYAGDPKDIDAVEPVLQALSPVRFHVGATGMAARAKLATNLVLGLNRAALAEGMVLAQHLGIEPGLFLDLVLASPARSAAAQVKGRIMVEREFTPQSRIRQHLKDVQLMLQLARQQQQALPLSEAHCALLLQAIEAGDGELDNAAIIRQIERSKTDSGEKLN